MNQKLIKKLLIEASKESTSLKRKTEIHLELGKASASFNGEYYNTTTPAAGMNVILDTLYMSCLINRPAELPRLLPVFILICGDREEKSIIADIDWAKI